jgi:hypothetical protein
MTLNETLFELQAMLGTAKDGETLEAMYKIFFLIARSIVPQFDISYGRGELENFDDLAHDAAVELVRRYLENPNYRVRKCFKATIRFALRNITRPKLKFDSQVIRIDDLYFVEDKGKQDEI